jgi:hypothetical protein
MGVCEASEDTSTDSTEGTGMTERLTPTQQLASLKLGRPLDEYVAEKRSARPRWSWSLIAEQLATDTDGQVSITGEALRLWYGEVAA